MLQAYYAMRHHPVFRPADLKASLAHNLLTVGVAKPLDPLPAGTPLTDRVPGLALHATAEAATLHARGLTRATDGLPCRPQAVCPSRRSTVVSGLKQRIWD